MDYSASIHDADNPAAASPWGSSPTASPKHTRTSSFPTSEAASSPPSYSSHPTGRYGHDDDLDRGYNRPESSAGDSTAASDAGRPVTADSVPPSHPEEQQKYRGQDQPKQTGSQAQRNEPQRYHGVARHAPSAPTQQQYKLQAKITGLERTGRKDPILRFDVHVGNSNC